MTAKGKINASNVQVNDRIIVQVSQDPDSFWVRASDTKTGEGVQVARVIGKAFRPAGRYEARGKYVIHTTAGNFEAAPIQTMWLAPEDAAGVKRAFAEALHINASRSALDEIIAEEVSADQEEPGQNEQDEIIALRQEFPGALAGRKEEIVVQLAILGTVVYPVGTPEYAEYHAELAAALTDWSTEPAQTAVEAPGVSVPTSEPVTAPHGDAGPVHAAIPGLAVSVCQRYVRGHGRSVGTGTLTPVGRYDLATCPDCLAAIHAAEPLPEPELNDLADAIVQSAYTKLDALRAN